MSLLVNAVSNRQQSNNDHHQSVFAKIVVRGMSNANEASIDLLEMFTHPTRQNQVLSESVLGRLKRRIQAILRAIHLSSKSLNI